MQFRIEAVQHKQLLTKVGELPEGKAEMHPMKGAQLNQANIEYQFLGSIYFNDADESKIIIKGFYYPQPGPDAFFWAGEDEPGCSEQSVEGRNYLLAPGQVGSKLLHQF